MTTSPGSTLPSAALKVQLADAIKTHTEITLYMVAKGYYHLDDLGRQFEVDLTAAQTAEELAQRQ
ncbi:hypothetical protein [Bacillus sp. FJAT-27445]|uniref:hypothetical protein n=1 Tax=Bacillus sp. FJAT-27445 TaxID=1679166 RepID=UPI000743AB1C|nr:hypothetical protein [Bacillus sp. FJAT-27445]